MLIASAHTYKWANHIMQSMHYQGPSIGYQNPSLHWFTDNPHCDRRGWREIVISGNNQSFMGVQKNFYLFNVSFMTYKLTIGTFP